MQENIESQRHLVGLILGLEISGGKELMSALVWNQLLDHDWLGIRSRYPTFLTCF